MAAAVGVAEELPRLALANRREVPERLRFDRARAARRRGAQRSRRDLGVREPALAERRDARVEQGLRAARVEVRAARAADGGARGSRSPRRRPRARRASGRSRTPPRRDGRARARRRRLRPRPRARGAFRRAAARNDARARRKARGTPLACVAPRRVVHLCERAAEASAILVAHAAEKVRATASARATRLRCSRSSSGSRAAMIWSNSGNASSRPAERAASNSRWRAASPGSPAAALLSIRAEQRDRVGGRAPTSSSALGSSAGTDSASRRCARCCAPELRGHAFLSRAELAATNSPILQRPPTLFSASAPAGLARVRQQRVAHARCRACTSARSGSASSEKRMRNAPVAPAAAHEIHRRRARSVPWNQGATTGLPSGRKSNRPPW